MSVSLAEPMFPSLFQFVHIATSISLITYISNIRVSGSKRQVAYDTLESWLRLKASKTRDMSQTRVYLGPNASYFAVSPVGGVTWASIPARLEALIDLNQPARAPILIALGIEETWFALWQDGSSSCNLDVEYPNLERLLRRHGKSGVKVCPQVRPIPRLPRSLLSR